MKEQDVALPLNDFFDLLSAVTTIPIEDDNDAVLRVLGVWKSPLKEFDHVL